MVAGIQRYLLRATEQTLDKRQRHWCRDTSSSSAYVESVAANRQRLAQLIGAQDQRSAPELSYLTDKPIAHSPHYDIHPVRWRTFARLDAEGLLLQPIGRVRSLNR